MRAGLETAVNARCPPRFPGLQIAVPKAKSPRCGSPRLDTVDDLNLRRNLDDAVNGRRIDR